MLSHKYNHEVLYAKFEAREMSKIEKIITQFPSETIEAVLIRELSLLINFCENRLLQAYSRFVSAPQSIPFSQREKLIDRSIEKQARNMLHAINKMRLAVLVYKPVLTPRSGDYEFIRAFGFSHYIRCYWQDVVHIDKQ